MEEKVFIPIRWLISFGAVNILWLLFSSESVGQWKSILIRIIQMKNTSVSDGLIASFSFPENQFIYSILGLKWLPESVRGFNMIVFLFVAFLICTIPENNYRTKDRINIGWLVLSSVAFVWGVLCLGTETTFVYFGF